MIKEQLMFRTLKKDSLLVKNIDIKIKRAVGYKDYEIAEFCKMDVEVFRRKWKEVLEQEKYLNEHGFTTDANELMRNGIFCINGMK